jgi:hypothetical protein
VLLISLVCAVLLGVIAPALIGAAVGFLDPSASDKWDDLYFLPAIGCLFLAGPTAAAVASYSVSRALLARRAGGVTTARNPSPPLALAAAALAVILSWLLVLKGWIYDLLDALLP